MKPSHLTTLLALTTAFALAVAAFAAVPQTINYQGYLKNTDGTPVTVSTSIRFSLYSSNPARNNPVWREIKSVTPANGIYSTQLGSATPITAPFDVPYHLGIKVAGDAEMPLQPLASAPYAMKAATVTDSSITSSSISGAIAANKLDLSGVVKKSGDSMSGALTLPVNGIAVGTNQLVTSGGNVGIGTSSPSQKLEVAGTAQVTTLRFSGDGTTMNSAGLIPSMNGPYFLNAVFAGDLKSARTASSVVLSKDVTVTRVQVTLREPGLAACWPRPLISVSDGSKGVRVPLKDSSHYDTGPIVIPFTAGSTLSVQLVAARMTATCSSGYPSDANVAVEYRLKAAGDTATCGADQLSCNGYCSSASSDADNCNTCATACPDGAGCVTGYCGNYCQAGQTVCSSGGKCLDLMTDINNCGACGITCTTGQICTNGGCVDVTCPSGQTPCPTVNGAICVNTSSDAAHCGKCGFDCKGVVAGAATVACVNSSCQATSCQNDIMFGTWGDCDNNMANGCETPLTTSQNCGSCGNACLTGLCTQLKSCINGWCSPNGNVGCSTDSITADTPCEATVSHTSSPSSWVKVYQCVSGPMGIPVCSWVTPASTTTTYTVGKCDDANPCTADSCKADGTGCSHTLMPDSTPCLLPLDALVAAWNGNSTQSVCKGGACLPLCPSGQGHCGPAQECIDIMSDGTNCGSCGRICKSMATCQDGSCLCLPPYSDCGLFCKNLTNDVDHCGACGNKCTGGYPCTNGECKCPTGTTMCNGTCVNTAISETHCGGCGIICAADQTCVSSVCTVCSGVNRAICTGFGGDRTCVNIWTDRNNCGGCGNRCPLLSVCLNGYCR